MCIDLLSNTGIVTFILTNNMDRSAAVFDFPILIANSQLANTISSHRRGSN